MRISDWSSDVCSSDLPRFKDLIGQDAAHHFVPKHPKTADAAFVAFFPPARCGRDLRTLRLTRAQNTGVGHPLSLAHIAPAHDVQSPDQEIGRASCRERVCQYG